MKSFVLVLASIVGVSAVNGHATDGERSIAYLSDISAMVEIGGGCGTGVFVTIMAEPGITRSYVWTAGHVADCLLNDDGSYENATIRREHRRGGKIVGESTIQAKVLVHDSGYGKPDLALLEVLAVNYLPVNISAALYLAEDIPGVGVEVCHMGCTYGLYNSYSEGVVSQTDVQFGGEEFDQTTVMAYPGSSGGGVYLEESKELIGILVRGHGPGLNFIVPVRVMREWAIANNVPWVVDPSLYPVPSC